MGQATLAAEKGPRGKLGKSCQSIIHVREEEEEGVGGDGDLVGDMLNVMSVGMSGKSPKATEIRIERDKAQARVGRPGQPPWGRGHRESVCCRHLHLAVLGPAG